MIWRKPALVLLFLCLLQTGHAQILKNTIMAGGNLGFQFTTDHAASTDDFTFSFSPLIGGFISRNVALGVAPTVSYMQSAGHYQDSLTSISLFTSRTMLGIGPFVRYYIKIGPKAFIYLHASPSVMAEWDKFSKDASQPVQKTVTASWQIGPGLSVMVSKTVALEVGAYYMGTWHRVSQEASGNLLSEGPGYIDNGMVLNVGFQVYFERKPKDGQPQK